MPFYKAYGLAVFSEIELPELSVAGEETAWDLCIRRGEVVLPVMKKTPIYRRGIRALFGKDQEGNLILHWEGVATYKAMLGNQLIISPLTEDANLLSLFTVSEALGLILFQKGYFLLHASAVKVGGKAWCFMGNPGAGKSTTAAAFVKAGCPLLSDDLTAITFDGGGKAVVIPGYPQLKIWDNAVEGLAYDRSDVEPVSEGVNKFSYKPDHNFDHEPVPLGEVYFLHKAKNKTVLQVLNASAIPLETLKNFPLPIGLLSGESLKNHFLQSFQCAGSAKMWRKRRPEGFASLERWVNESISLNAEVLHDI
jgi:hypothetical protein